MLANSKVYLINFFAKLLLDFYEYKKLNISTNKFALSLTNGGAFVIINKYGKY